MYVQFEPRYPMEGDFYSELIQLITVPADIDAKYFDLNLCSSRGSKRLAG